MSTRIRGTGFLAQIGGAGLAAVAAAAEPPRLALNTQDCIPPAERARVEAEIAANRLRLGLPAGGWGASDAGVTPYAFHPQAGNYFQDLWVVNFVDLNTTNLVRTFECTDWAYNGHAGHDIMLRSFGEQQIGVPIYAALEGTVVYAHDGEPDMNTSCTGTGNAVAIQHAGPGGQISYYWHLKLGSVAVAVGQPVKAGQILGLTASSGCSSGPHLHFETNVAGAPYEPFAGACRAGPSGWVNQPPLVTDTYVNELCITATNPASVSWYPVGGTANPPRHAQIAFTDQTVYIIAMGGQLPSSGMHRYRFYRPDGTLALDSSPQPYPAAGAGVWFGGNGASRWALWIHYRGFNIPDLGSYGNGTWRVILEINGSIEVDAPIEVVQVRDPQFNRPPRPITAALDPLRPTQDDVVFCRVKGESLYADDLDWDIVRYRYVWTVNGAVIRDATTAAMSDALPRGTALHGQTLKCTVTPSDGKPNGTGAPASAAATIGCYPDCNADGAVAVADFGCFQTRFVLGDPWADCNLDGQRNVADFGCFQTAFVSGCP